MVESLTQNYGWTKPEITKSPVTWGGFLNVDLDSIDAIVFALQQGISPIGGMMMWGGVTPPANWLICDGSSLDTTTYAALFAAIQYTHGGSGANFNLPPFSQRFPMGSGPNPPGQTGGAFQVTLTVPNLPVHSHTVSIVDPTHYHTIPGWAHTHTAYQDGHTHYVYQDVHAHTVGNSPHSHNIVTGNHAHNIHTGGHSHGLDHQVLVPQGGPNVPGGALWGFGNARTDAAGDLGGYTDTAGNLGGYTDAQYANVGNTDNRQPGVHADTQYPAIHVSTDVANIPYANYGSTGITANGGNTGGGAAFNVVPPFVAVPIIIRYR